MICRMQSMHFRIRIRLIMTSSRDNRSKTRPSLTAAHSQILNQSIPIRPMTPPPVDKLRPAKHSSAQLKPANQFRLETRPAPPVYRPQQKQNSNVQAKVAVDFCLEKRSAPSAYRPQQAARSSPSTPSLKPPIQAKLPSPSGTRSQGLVAPPGGSIRVPHAMVRVVQRMEDNNNNNNNNNYEGTSTGSTDVAQDNYNVLLNYRTGFLDEVEDAFLSMGYNISNIRQGIMRGLRAWNKVIPGHSTQKGKTDKGEQGKLDEMCIEAKDFLIAWAYQNPPGAKPKSTGLKHSEDQQKLVARQKQQGKEDKAANKHRQWHANNPSKPQPCQVCYDLGLA